MEQEVDSTLLVLELETTSTSEEKKMEHSCLLSNERSLSFSFKDKAHENVTQ